MARFSLSWPEGAGIIWLGRYSSRQAFVKKKTDYFRRSTKYTQRCDPGLSYATQLLTQISDSKIFTLTKGDNVRLATFNADGATLVAERIDVAGAVERYLRLALVRLGGAGTVTFWLTVARGINL